MRAVAAARTRYSSSSSGRSARMTARCRSTVSQSPRAIGPVSSKCVSTTPRMSGSSASGGAPAASSSEPAGRAQRDEVVRGHRCSGVVGGRARRRRARTAAGRGSRRATGRPHVPRPSPPSRRPRRRRAARRRAPSRTICRGCSPKRRTCGSSARSGVAPLTCAIQGPTRRLCRDLGDRAVRDAQEDELRRRARRAGCRARASRALTAEPTRPRAPTIRIRSIIRLLQFPFGIPGSGSVPCARYFSASRASRCARTAGQSSSVTLYQALSRFSPLADEHVLAVDALEGRAERLERAARALVLRVGLALDAAAAPARRTRARSCRSFASTFAPVPQADGCSQVQPISTERCSGRSARKRVEPTISPVAHGHERELGPGGRRVERLLDEGAPLLARLRLDDAEPAPGPRVARGEPEASSCSGRSGSSRDDAAFERRCRPPHPPRRDSTLDACRSTSTRAWSASRTSTSSSARATRP